LFLTLRDALVWVRLRGGCWGEYLDPRGTKKHKDGKVCIMRCFIICTPHKYIIRMIKSRRMRCAIQISRMVEMRH